MTTRSTAWVNILYTSSGIKVKDVPLSTTAWKLVCLRQALVPIQIASTPTTYVELNQTPIYEWVSVQDFIPNKVCTINKLKKHTIFLLMEEMKSNDG